jgi:N-acetylglucosaminyldiphosphoundecaprenol N-acetyl-beta-D-mannosaminyltransferase
VSEEINAASALRAHAPSDADLPLPVQVATVGGLPIAVINRADCAKLMVDLATARRNEGRPALVFTSANGQVVSMCEASAEIRALFLACDLINADGMPLVFASQFLSDRKLPERAATTDLVYEVAEIAQERGASFYLLGAAAGVIERAVEHLHRIYPRLKIVGYRDGYFGAEEEADVVAAINAAHPDILWLGLGVPAEQRFALRHREHLRGVGVIKTSGGLFDFLSGKNRRAPEWMQALGLEWAFRIYLEPRRLLGRYVRTNPHALFLLLTKTRSAKAGSNRPEGS